MEPTKIKEKLEKILATLPEKRMTNNEINDPGYCVFAAAHYEDVIKLARKKLKSVINNIEIDATEKNANIPIDEAHFPDEKFRNYVAKYCSGDDEVLTPEDIAETTEINCSSKGIRDFTGIEYFTALECFDCDHNDLKTLDISHNTALEKLYCYANELTELDVSKNTALKELDCSDNHLRALNVSGCTALKELNCCANDLEALNVSNNTTLKTLYCSDNNITTLDISHNFALKTLGCSRNHLTTLDVSNNTALKDLECENNASEFALIKVKEPQEKSFADMSGDERIEKALKNHEDNTKDIQSKGAPAKDDATIK